MEIGGSLPSCTNCRVRPDFLQQFNNFVTVHCFTRVYQFVVPAMFT